jgi:hypothetical protein
MRERPIYSADREKNVPGGDRSPKIIESIIVSSLNLFSFSFMIIFYHWSLVLTNDQ